MQQLLTTIVKRFNDNNQSSICGNQLHWIQHPTEGNWVHFCNQRLMFLLWFSVSLSHFIKYILYSHNLFFPLTRSSNTKIPNAMAWREFVKTTRLQFRQELCGGESAGSLKCRIKYLVVFVVTFCTLRSNPS